MYVWLTWHIGIFSSHEQKNFLYGNQFFSSGIIMYIHISRIVLMYINMVYIQFYRKIKKHTLFNVQNNVYFMQRRENAAVVYLHKHTYGLCFFFWATQNGHNILYATSSKKKNIDRNIRSQKTMSERTHIVN